MPEMLAGMATLLQVGLERMLDLVVAWEDVASVRYDCAAMKFKPLGTQMGGGAPTGAPHAVEFLHQEIADLRRKLDAQSAAQSKSKSAKTDYLKGVLTAGLIEEFLQEPAIPEWMTDLCQLLTKALDEELLEDPSVPANDLWKLLITKYDERYHKGRGSRRRRSTSRHKTRRHRSSSSSHKGKKSRRPRRSRSSSTESSSDSGSESGEETYYRGKFKFIVRDGTEFLIASNGREWRADKRPPRRAARCPILAVTSTCVAPRDTRAFLGILLDGEVIAPTAGGLPGASFSVLGPCPEMAGSARVRFLAAAPSAPYGGSMVSKASKWAPSSASEPSDLQPSSFRPAARDIGHNNLAMRAVPLMNCHRPTSPSTRAGLGRCSSVQGLSSQVATQRRADLTDLHLPHASNSWTVAPCLISNVAPSLLQQCQRKWSYLPAPSSRTSDAWSTFAPPLTNG